MSRRYNPHSIAILLKLVAEKDLDVCLVCSEFKTEHTIKSEDLMSYLQEKNILSGPGKGKTYWQFLDTGFGVGISKTKDIIENTYYQVILQNVDADSQRLNLLLLRSSNSVSDPNFRCDVYHYQKE